MPPLSGVRRQPTRLGRRATGADFGAQLGAAGAAAAQPVAELGDIAFRFAEARESARVSRALAESGLDLENLASQIDAEPDERKHLELLNAGREQIRKTRSEGLHGRSLERFEDGFTLPAGRTELRVNSNIRARQIAASLDDVEVTVDSLTQLASRAEGDELAALQAQAAGALGSAQGAGILTQEQAGALMERFQKKVPEAKWRAGKNTDPVGTLEAVRGREGVYADMDEIDRQNAISQLEVAVRQEQNIAKAQEREADQARKDAERDIREGVAKDGFQLASDGGMTTQWVQQNRDALTPSLFSHFLGEATKVTAGPAVPDPVAYHDLEILKSEDPAAFLRATIDPAKVGNAKARELTEDKEKLRLNLSRTPSGSKAKITAWLETLPDTSDQQKADMRLVAEAGLLEDQRKLGRPLDDAQQQSSLDRVELQRFRQTPRPISFIFGETEEILQEDAPIDVPGVPSEHVNAIVTALQKQGQRVTMDSILKTWQRASGGAR